MAGPLSGIKLVEFAGIGPGPFCGMILADWEQKLSGLIDHPNMGVEIQ